MSTGGSGYATIEVFGNAPGTSKYVIDIPPLTTLDFFVRFAYLSPLTGKWAYLPAGVDAWIFAGEPGTTVGEKVPTVAAPQPTHLHGPKPARPADIGLCIEFGANKAIDPASNTLVDMEEGKLLVPVPEQWTSIASFASDGRKLFFKNSSAGHREGSEQKPLDVMLPSQVFFYNFRFPVPAAAVEIGGRKGIPLHPGTDDGQFFDVLYGPITEENHFKWKVTLTEEQEKFDVAARALIANSAGDPAGEFEYLNRESDNSAIEFPKAVINGSLEELLLQDVPLVKPPSFAEGTLHHDDEPSPETNFLIVLPNGTEIPGRTDAEGKFRVEPIPPVEYRLKLGGTGEPTTPSDAPPTEAPLEGPPTPGEEPPSPPVDVEPPTPGEEPPPTPAQAAQSEDGEDVYVVAALVKMIGDTPLLNNAVRIIDPDTGKTVKEAETDDAGVVRVEVPENKPYRIEIVDDAIEIEEAPPPHPEDKLGLLVCHFLDAAGKPVANEAVELKVGGDNTPMETDADGRLKAPVPLAPCELKLRGQTFLAHAVPASDAEDEANVYEFVLRTA